MIKEFAEELKEKCSRSEHKWTGGVSTILEITEDDFDELIEKHTTPKKDCAEEIGCGKYLPDICDDGDRYWDGNCGDEWGILCAECSIQEHTTPKKDCVNYLTEELIQDIKTGVCPSSHLLPMEEDFDCICSRLDTVIQEHTTPKNKGDDFNLSKKRLQIDEYCINDYHYNEEDVKEFIRKIEEYKEHVTDRKCPNEPLEMLMDFILDKAGDDLK